MAGYNLAIWPVQIFACVLVIAALFFSFKVTRYSLKIVFLILSLFWLFTGILFCLIYWAPVHIFGYIFGICCVLQGLILLYGATISRMSSASRANANRIFGILFVLYAAVGYQVFGYYLGHVYPEFFAVGLVPCPTTILTFGIFLLIDKKIPMRYFIIPFIISLGGILAAYEGIYEDIGLIVVGISGTILLTKRARGPSQGP